MGRSMIEDTMLLRTDADNDQLTLSGDTVGFDEPCVTAATDAMADLSTWVYLPLEDAVAEIIDNKDNISVDEWAARIRAAVERGIEKGRKARALFGWRRPDGRLAGSTHSVAGGSAGMTDKTIKSESFQFSREQRRRHT